MPQTNGCNYRHLHSWDAHGRQRSPRPAAGPTTGRGVIDVLPAFVNPERSSPTGALDRLALEMTGTLELDALLESVTRGLVADFGVALARIWLVEPGEATMHLRASSGLSQRLDGSYARVAIGARKIGRIAETRQAMATNDVAHDERIADHAWAASNGLVAFAGWPLTFRGTLEGVLAVFARRELTDDERPRMALFAHQAAIAIKNARLFAEVRSLKERLQAENAYLRREAAGGDDDAFALLGRCPGLAHVLGQVRKVAPTSTSVLLHGETGTGKELLARAVHELSPRRTAPLVRVNCAALSPSLVESELFGHERGAFTGAQQKRLGRFELADGGTLLLDEVGEVPLEMQPKLLRVLQEQEFERVGGTRPVRVDVRVVSATNRNLAMAVEEGRFRADLFYRLAVFPIEVPPLRARGGDCAILAEAFLRSQAHRLGKSLASIATGAQARLLAHDWPGNVRELANVIERAAIVASGPVLTETDLPPLMRLDAANAGRPVGPVRASSSDTERVDGSSGAAPESGDLRLESVERAHVVRVLEQTGWVIEGKKGAASALGLAPSTLRSRMAQLAIRRR
jgi:transcriptional regulator with GAF, ATPase, and Fis domain